MSDASQAPGRLWGGRFEGVTDALVEKLNNSLPFDSRLWRHDILGSVAHATMLGETGIIPAEESKLIVETLHSISMDIGNGNAQLDPTAEDIHSAVELMLRLRLGPVAGKLHTARSRNDQVATDTRLYLRDAIGDISDRIESFQETLVGLAEQEMSASTPTIMPGFTHLQHAQPILLAHHLLAYFWMLQRDRERLADAIRRVNILPLGAGALAGTSFPIDRKRVAELLGFDDVAQNSLDAVSDRDFAMEFLADCAIVAVHLSRLAEEIILWNSPEFGFIELHDSVTTGSSIMPQKKNPDVAELARGKAGRIIGDLMTLLVVMKGLPLAYNKDMQEDKEPLFDAIDTLMAVLPPFEKTLATARFKRERMAQALHRDFSTATDLADLLVRKGLPFRDAHHVVGRIVRYCIEKSIGLEELDAATLNAFSPEFGNDVENAASLASSVNSRNSVGGTSPLAVGEQIKNARLILSQFKN